MNFSASHAGGSSCILRLASTVWLIKEPNIRQLMRISVLLIALLLTCVPMLMATTGHGQSAENTKVTLSLKNESLTTALKRIEAQTPFRFVYRNNEVKAINSISLEGKERTVAATLSLILAKTPFRYREINTNILIYKDSTSTSAGSQTEAAVDHTVRGKVLDETGSPLAGVSILLKGTTTGTYTDAEGVYTLTTPESTGILLFSFIGYKMQEIEINGRAVIDLNLTPDLQSLNEVVVTALGISREEKSLGYATQEVKAKDLTYTKEQNIVGSLAGKIAGVQVIGSPGASMGGTQKIKIRGVNVLAGDDTPLFILDGTPMANTNFSERNGQDYGNVLQDINPDDIESVNVLKGPAASALYGLRGQNGVVMITTKKGARGAKKVSIDYSGAFSMERAGNFMPNQNLYGGGSTLTFATLDNGQPYSNLDFDESWGPRMDGTPVRQFYSFFPQDPDYGKLTPYVPQPDNIKDYYEIGHTVNNNIAVSGGAENSTFRLSFNRTTISGVEPNTWLKRNNVGFNGSLDVTKKITLSTGLNYANNQGQRPGQGYDYGSTYFNQWFQRNLDMKRLKNYKYADGTFLHWNLDNPEDDGTLPSQKPLYWNNPYFEAYENFSNDSRDRFFGNIALSYQVLPQLTVSGTIRGDIFTQNIDLRSAAGGRYIEGYSIRKAQNTEMNYEFLAHYKKDFNEFSVDVTAGGNLMTQEYSSLSQETQGGLVAPGLYNVSNSVDRPLASSYLREKEIRSLFALVAIGYKDTWFIDASLRNDNSSALPPDNNSYWYPSVSGSAVFSELIDWKPLSLGKLRVSYAVAGSDLDPYQTSPYYKLGTPYGSDPSVNSLYVPDKLNNPNLKPSFSNSFEVGLDLKFFSNRLGLAATYYIQENKNQILTLPVSGASGYAEAVINAGTIENKGYEIALTAVPLRTDKFSWNATFNISKNQSMIVELYNDGITEINNHQISSNTYAGRTVSLNARVGEAYGTLIGQAYRRDPATGKIMLGSNNLPLYEANHNFGTVLPDFTGGFQNTFSYGPISLNAMIDFQFGGQFFSWSRMLSVKSGQAVETAAINDNGKNVRDNVAEGGGVKVNGISSVTGEEVTAYVPARSYYRTVLGREIYEEWLYDASYIRLREVRLSYNLGKGILKNLPVNSVSVALIARNPLMIWQRAPEGLNPAELANGSEPISWLETGQLVTVRSYGLSLNVSF
jgi:TonB-linked SusC/RagA family outer membrane protein